MRFIIFFMILLISQSVFSSASYYQYNSNDPSDLDFLWASEQIKDESSHELIGSYTKMDISYLYHLTPRYDVRFFLSNVYLQNREKEDEFNTDLAEVMLRDREILKNYFPHTDIQLELKSYYLVDANKRELYGFTGAFIPQLVMNNKTSKKTSLETKIRRHFYYHNNKDSTLHFEDRIYITPYYFLDRKNFLGLQFNYRHKVFGNDYFSYRSFSEVKKDQEVFKIHPSYIHLYNKNMLLEFYAETYLSRTTDKRTINQIAKDDFVLGFSAFINIF